MVLPSGEEKGTQPLLALELCSPTNLPLTVSNSVTPTVSAALPLQPPEQTPWLVCSRWDRASEVWA